MDKLIFYAKEIDGEMRMSDYLKRRLGFSSGLITKVKYGGVFKNGEVVTMRASVKNTDVITVYFPDEEGESAPPKSIPLDIIYEDAHVLLVDKPSNMPTHPAQKNSLPTLANAISAYMGEGFVFRAINRLDRDTSGIVLIAKNPYAAARLGKAMKEHKIKKTYSALVSGIPSPAEGRISVPIARESEDSVKRIVREDGKEAITDYKVTKILPDGNSVLRINLHTGRTHQIRVHMCHIGHPLVGDFLYGTRTEEGYKLRCTEIVFPHPETLESITVTAEEKF